MIPASRTLATHGCQRRNGTNFELCKELLKSGALGKLETLYANVGPSVNWPPLPSRDWLAAEELPPKQVLDWERWLGPAPWRPYNSAYVRGDWRNFYDFHGGGILEWVWIPKTPSGLKMRVFAPFVRSAKQPLGCALPLVRLLQFCRIRQKIRATPAMEAGITDCVWELAEFLA